MIQASILVVEDERIVARDMERTLTKAGYRVVETAASGKRAIQLAEDTRPDLVLMDVVLAGEMDGIEAARMIRQRREIPIVYLTANGDHTVLEQAKSTEPIAFILKPCEERELLASIEMALHQYRAHQQRAAEALRASEARYQELFETACDGIAIIGLQGEHLDCNRAYLNLLGYASTEELLPRLLSDVTVPDWREQERRIFQDQTLPRGYSNEYEKECFRKDGSRVAVGVRSWLRRGPDGQPVGYCVMVRDISERKEAERRIRDYQRQLQGLMRELALVEERERQRIATDIHDRISQTLAACQMRLEALVQSLNAPALSQEAECICQLLDQTIRDTSSLIFDLSPPVLYQLGLGPALEWFGEKIEKQHGHRIEIQWTQPAPALTVDQRVAVFRAACELITNAVKHAQAKNIHVRLEDMAGVLQLSVEDDGTGFIFSESVPGKRDRGGFGLFHIQERMRAWGGALEINSLPGSGTRAMLALPLNVAPSAHQGS